MLHANVLVSREKVLHADMLSSKGQSTISKELKGRVAGVVVEVD